MIEIRSMWTCEHVNWMFWPNDAQKCEKQKYVTASHWLIRFLLCQCRCAMSKCRLLATFWSEPTLGTFEWNHILNWANVVQCWIACVECWVKCLWQFVRDLHPIWFVSCWLCHRSHNQSELDFFLSFFSQPISISTFAYSQEMTAASEELMATRAN